MKSNLPETGAADEKFCASLRELWIFRNTPSEIGFE
jgi:hypothetical protein